MTRITLFSMEAKVNEKHYENLRKNHVIRKQTNKANLLFCLVDQNPCLK
jgi:hypothetical protein